MHGDGDGMVRIPGDLVDAVIGDARSAMAAENKVRTAILEGVDPRTAYETWGKF
jgi:regulator of RNase E activity RraA